MSQLVSADDARQSLNLHLAAKGKEIHTKYGPRLGWNELQQLLQDPACVRYPCEVVFDAGRLQPGEFAHPESQGDRPEDGFIMAVHPHFETQLDRVPYLVLYQLVLVNYGAFASSDDAETFASSALGISREEYYQILCEMADELTDAKSPGLG